jgi:hypothetical protein
MVGGFDFRVALVFSGLLGSFVDFRVFELQAVNVIDCLQDDAIATASHAVEEFEDVGIVTEIAKDERFHGGSGFGVSAVRFARWLFSGRGVRGGGSCGRRLLVHG